jgi:transcriptional regulator with XRE-family HTH domain
MSGSRGIGTRSIVRGLRDRLELSQEGLARLLNVSLRSVSRWELGKAQPDGFMHDRLLRLRDIVDSVPRDVPGPDLVRWLSSREAELELSTPVEVLVNDFGLKAVKSIAFRLYATGTPA